MLIVIAALLGVVGFAIGFSAFGALLRARLFRFVFSALLSVVLLAAGAVLALLALGIAGVGVRSYRERQRATAKPAAMSPAGAGAGG